MQDRFDSSLSKRPVQSRHLYGTGLGKLAHIKIPLVAVVLCLSHLAYDEGPDQDLHYMCLVSSSCRDTFVGKHQSVNHVARVTQHKRINLDSVLGSIWARRKLKQQFCSSRTNYADI